MWRIQCFRRLFQICRTRGISAAVAVSFLLHLAAYVYREKKNLQPKTLDVFVRFLQSIQSRFRIESLLNRSQTVLEFTRMQIETRSLRRSRTGCFGPRPNVIAVFSPTEGENAAGFRSNRRNTAYTKALLIYVYPDFCVVMSGVESAIQIKLS